MKGFVILLSVLLLLAVALPAMAEVDVTATIDKTKEVTVTESIDKVKTVNINVTVDEVLSGAAEASAIVNVENGPNSVDESDVTRYDEIVASVLGNIGITLLNQSSGNMNNQGNVVSAAVSNNGFAEAQAAVGQNNYSNDVDSLDVTRYDSIDGYDSSINGNLGITAVNQSCGNMNNQTTAVALAAGLEGTTVVLAEADLGQTVVNAQVYELSVTKWDHITDSINGNHGVTAVNQSSGNMNQQANVVSIAGMHP
jgi:hypothetical protein